MGIIWHEFSTRIIEPINYVVTHVAVSMILNTIFCSVAYQTTPRKFIKLAYYFGFCHLLFFSSTELFLFYVYTVTIFFSFYLFSFLVRKFFGWSCRKFLTIFVLLNTLHCFRQYKNNDNIYDFVLTYIILTGKFFCAIDCFHKKSNFIILQPGKPCTFKKFHKRSGFIMLQLHTLASYLIYAPWISLKDFLHISMNNQRDKNEDWRRMVKSAIKKAIFYKILSHTLVDLYNQTTSWKIPILYSVMHGFQYRCKYYCRAQMVQLQLLAAGVQKRQPLKVHDGKIKKSTYKRMSWLRPYVFDLRLTESSTCVMSFLTRLNKPLFPFIYKRLKKGTNNFSTGPVLIHSTLLLVIIGSYNYDCVLSAGFLGGVMIQEAVVKGFEKVFDVCFYKCSTLLCRHRFGPRKFRFHSINYILLIHNQIRLSLLFVRHELVEIASYVGGNNAILTDEYGEFFGWFMYEFWLILFLYFMYLAL